MRTSSIPVLAACLFMATLCLAACADGSRPAEIAATPAPITPPPPSKPPPSSAPLGQEQCDSPASFRAAAAYNAAASINLIVSPFGRPETGWAIYAPQIAEAAQTRCAPDSADFAEAVSRWQAAHGVTPDGAVSADTLQVFKGVWQEERPFVMLRVAKICPPGADETTLEPLKPDEVLGDKTVLLRPAALAALRRMVDAARLEVAETQSDPDLLKAFSGYRSPVADDARCKQEGNCQGMVRAQCSVHRTGLAVDLNVGFAPGFMADSSVDANRLHQSQTETYRWLVRNAARFGFVNYVFEPWHWEWTGEAP